MNYALLIPECINYYLDGFRKADYPTCFQRYCQQTEEVFRQIALQDPEECALGLIDWIDAHPGRFFRKRHLADRQMLMLQYTAPAAVKLGQEDFAMALSRLWKQRHPDFPFRVGTYEDLYKGFNNTILGFKLPKGED